MSFDAVEFHTQLAFCLGTLGIVFVENIKYELAKWFEHERKPTGEIEDNCLVCWALSLIASVLRNTIELVFMNAVPFLKAVGSTHFVGIVFGGILIALPKERNDRGRS